MPVGHCSPIEGLFAYLRMRLMMSVLSWNGTHHHPARVFSKLEIGDVQRLRSNLARPALARVLPYAPLRGPRARVVVPTNAALGAQ